jgi:hypothetical protein
MQTGPKDVLMKELLIRLRLGVISALVMGMRSNDSSLLNNHLFIQMWQRHQNAFHNPHIVERRRSLGMG